MLTTNSYQLDVIDAEARRSLVSRLLDDGDADVLTWRAQEVHGGAGAGSHVFRVSGTASTTRNSRRDWSMMIKVLTLDSLDIQSNGAEPDAWNYWKREWLVYRSDWLADLPGPVVAPLCFGTGETQNADDHGVAWIALEDLSTSHQPWCHGDEPFDVARAVGAFTGGYLAGQAVPAAPWLAEDWLRGWTEQAAPVIEELAAAARHPVTGRVLTSDVVSDLRWAWEHREMIFAVIAELPRTFCHDDFFHRNLFVRGGKDQRCVAIDWATCGWGAIGQELSALVGATTIFRGSRPSEWDELETHCLNGYLAGLAATGVTHSEQARLGYLSAIVLRFGVGSVAPVVGLTASRDHEALVERWFGCGYEEFIDHAAAVMRFQTERIRQLRAVLAS